MLEQVKTIAVEAGKRILDYYHTDPGTTYKQDQSPLTLADQASHDVIVRGLRALTPEIPIISEEGVLPAYEQRSHFPEFWLVDPLDGTKEFIKRNDEFTVNIALIRGDRPILGVVFIPVLEKLYYAVRGEGAWRIGPDPEPVRLHAKPEFDPNHLIASISRSHPSGQLDAFLKRLNGLETMGLGSSLKFCYIAERQTDFYPRFGPLWEWDTAAAHLVAEESGAVVSDLEGNPLRYNKPVLKQEHGLIAASCPELRNFLFDKLRAH